MVWINIMDTTFLEELDTTFLIHFIEDILPSL